VCGTRACGPCVRAMRVLAVLIVPFCPHRHWCGHLLRPIAVTRANASTPRGEGASVARAVSMAPGVCVSVMNVVCVRVADVFLRTPQAAALLC
jgi:hypothetical protein